MSFTASGLPANAVWKVTFNSQTKSAASDSISFNVPNGNYAFTVTQPKGYAASPDSGSITVNSTNVTQQVTTTTITFTYIPAVLATLAVSAIIVATAVIANVLYKRNKANTQ